jgi:pyruvate/2-oxoglutarate dehydrogenase complex dihydrolipoamide dehydrogenase (E3) component
MKYTHDIVILGGGAAGLSVAAGCAGLGLKTALVEKKALGGDCLYYGCVPSKTLLKTASVRSEGRRYAFYGLPEAVLPPVDMGMINRRVQEVIRSIEPHDSPERFRGLGVDVRFSNPRFLSPHEVRFEDGVTLSARTIVLAVGSSPFVPPIPGIRETGFITNIEAFSLERLPETLLVVGGGPIGVELGQAFARLGSRVHIFDMAPRILPREDPDMAAVVEESLEADGVEVHVSARVLRAEKNDDGRRRLVVEIGGEEKSFEGDEILLVPGRMGNTGGLDAEKAGIQIEKGYFTTDDRLRTTAKHIYAIGDCNGKYLFTHVAGAEAATVVRSAVFRLPARIDYDHVPWVTYCDPEIASVGYNEIRAREAGISYTLAESPFDDIDRARAEGATAGKIKMLLDRKGRVIGCQIAGSHAGELLLPAIHAVRRKWKLMDIASPIYPYPTMSELHRRAASGELAKKLFNPRVRGILRFLFGYRGTEQAVAERTDVSGGNS